MPFATGLAAAVAVLGVLGSAPALGASGGAAGTPVRGQEWWLADLDVTQAWPTTVGAGVTVAVLGTGVDAGDADLAGDVITGPDLTGSGRAPGSPFWGINGTAVAGIIAGHGHGAGGQSGITGVAPGARILSVRVTLEFNDPLSSDPSVSRRLPGAIAEGITYAVAHGAKIIELPLDPGTLGLTGQGDPAAAGGSPAEQAAVDYALDNSVVLVAPAGDDGMGPGIVNYPAAYPGVIAVGAVSRDGQLASFSSRHSYVSLTAPGVGVEVAAPANGYQTTSSTSAASGMVAGVAALILSRFPHLTVAQVTQALTESTVAGPAGAGLPPLPARSPAGAGYGTVDAARAVQMAALITAASQPPVHPARPRPPARRPAAAPRRPGASVLARSVLRAALAGVCALILLLVVTLLVMRSRRERGHGPAAARTRARGLHEQHRAERVPVTPGPDRANGARRGPPVAGRAPSAADTWPSPGGWQGGSIGEITPSPALPSRPAVAPAPKAVAGYRPGRGADGKPPGPPWAPAPEPARNLGPLPVASPSSPPPEPGPGIRVPGDMAVPPGPLSEPPAAALPADLDAPTPPAGFALALPAFDFGPPPPSFGSAAPPAADVPSRPDLTFAAAPVTADYAGAFPAEAAAEDGPAPGASADPSYIWDLAATDVFPAATAGGRGAEAEAPAGTAGAPDAPPPPEGGSGGGGS